MKRPKPRDFGLNSDHPPVPSHYVKSLSADPAQPFTQEELDAALTRIVEREALVARQARYAAALAQFDYNNGGR